MDERAIFVRGPVVIFKWRNEDGWPVEYVSPNAAEVFGYSPEQFLSGEVAYGTLIHADDVDRVVEEVALAVAKTDSPSFVHEPYRVRHAEGTYRWLHDVTQVIRAEGASAPSHFIGYVVDITGRMDAVRERQALELKLLHTQKLESLGVLAGGVAHDFNNLLTGILGEASVAELDVRPEQTELRSSLVNIQNLAQRAAVLTQQLLAYSGRGQFVVEAVDLSLLVRTTAGMLKTVVSKKAQLRLDLGAVPNVRADRAQLQQVLMNLITNASEALLDQPGVIDLRTRSSTIEGERYVTLVVEDQGVGMDLDVQNQLFDPFFTTKTTGRGLGMSAVQGIVRAHNARIDVTSTPGAGTRFEVRFPATDEQPALEPAESSEGPWRGAGTALIVDDEPSVRTVAAKMLEHLGFKTLVASNGQEGLDLFIQNRDKIRLALVDLTMPVLGGVDAMRAMRVHSPSLRVILSSGFTEVPSAAELDHPTITAFCAKPYRLQTMRATVRSLLEHDATSL